MTPQSMTNEDRVRALGRFGYNDAEGKFLCLAGLHSGHFLRRQIGQSLGCQDGGTVSALIEKALERRHIHASTYGNKTQVYHLAARPFYAAIGQPNNRNRRRHEIAMMKARLMALDFVLANPMKWFLATEEEKIAHFTETLKVPLSKLPVKEFGVGETKTRRYFVDKYPLFLAGEPGERGESGATFCFVDGGATTLSHFETYLAQYKPLFASLETFNLIYVAASEVHFEGARRRFERLNGSVSSVRSEGRSVTRNGELQEHFEARQRYEANDFGAFDRQKLIRLRNDLSTFSGQEYDALYERWKRTGGLENIADGTARNDASPTARAMFSTYLLQSRYDFLDPISPIDEQLLEAV